MLIECKYDRSSGWSVDENVACKIPDIAEVLQGKSLGVKAVVFICLFCDPESPYVLALSDKKTLESECLKAAYKDEESPAGLPKNKLVAAAIDTYKTLCDTPVVKLIRQYQEGVESIGKYIQVHKNQLDDAEIRKDFMANVKLLPENIQKYKEMMEGVRESIDNVKSTITGKRELTYRESKLRKKSK